MVPGFCGPVHWLATASYTSVLSVLILSLLSIRSAVCIWHVVLFRVRPVSPKLGNEGMGSNQLIDNYLLDVKRNSSLRK
jgi:hypothetical protein